MESLENYNMSSVDYSSFDINLLKTIFEDYPDGFVFKDDKLEYVFANKSFHEFFGITIPEDLKGKTVFPYLSERNQKLICDAGKKVASTLEPLNYILNVNDIKGKDVVLSITTSPYVYNNKFCGVISIVKDITTEESIKEKFVLKHFQLKSLLENLPLIIYMQDKNGCYIIGTESSKKFFHEGYDSFFEIKFDVAKNVELLDEINKDVFKLNKPITIEQKILDVNSVFHWYKIYKIPVTDFKGKITGVLTVANNIDCEKKIEVQKETFVATLGHDLKNPTIAQIRGLELLLKGDFGSLSKEQTEIIEMVLDSCRYMNGMLSSLLATYRNNCGIVKLCFEDFLFSDLINECVCEMEYVAKDKGVKINTEKINNIDKARADRVQLKRVIMNLLSNGIKYAFKNSNIELRLNMDSEAFVFELENESPYIPEEERNKIFGRYVSYASTLHELGNGLGLYASKKIINSHDGKIFVKSFKDDKNIFGFSIPQKPKTNSSIKSIQF